MAANFAKLPELLRRAARLTSKLAFGYLFHVSCALTLFIFQFGHKFIHTSQIKF